MTRQNVKTRVSLVEQELSTFPEHPSSPRFLVGFVLLDLVSCVVFCRLLLFLVSFFYLIIVLSVLIRMTDSDYPFGVFKLFFVYLIRNGMVMFDTMHISVLLIQSLSWSWLWFRELTKSTLSLQLSFYTARTLDLTRDFCWFHVLLFYFIFAFFL